MVDRPRHPAQLEDDRPDRGQLGRHRVVLGDDGVTESTTVAAHVIPRRAFGDPPGAEAFFRLAPRRKEAPE